MIASFGILGAVTAFIFNKIFNWRTCYFIGGELGLILLLRVSVHESSLFTQVKHANV